MNYSVVLYMICGVVHGFWPAKKLAELADGATGCDEVASGGCLFAWNFTVARSTVLTQAGRTRANTTL
jgi:hypothetical protein